MYDGKRTHPPSTLVRLLYALLGAVFGLVVTVAIGTAILYMLHIVFEAVFGPFRICSVGAKAGLALIIMPIAGAVLGALVGWNFHQYDIGNRTQFFLNTSSMYDRASIAWAATWTTAFAVLILTLGPFWRDSRYWYLERDWLATALWWLVPIIGGFVASRMVAWIAKGTR